MLDSFFCLFFDETMLLVVEYNLQLYKQWLQLHIVGSTVEPMIFDAPLTIYQMLILNIYLIFLAGMPK